MILETLLISDLIDSYITCYVYIKKWDEDCAKCKRRESYSRSDARDEGDGREGETS